VVMELSTCRVPMAGFTPYPTEHYFNHTKSKRAWLT
jgi:hypothetical protein